MPEVRYLRRDERMQLTGANALNYSGARDRHAAVFCAGAVPRELHNRKFEAKQFTVVFLTITCAAVRDVFIEARPRAHAVTGLDLFA